MNSLFTSLIALLFCLLPVYSQTEIQGSLTGYIYRIIDDMPGRDNDDYADPSATYVDRWRVLTDSLLAGHYEKAAALAEEVGYLLVHLTDGGKDYYILRQQEGSGHFWGTYVLRPGGCRRVVIQSPHPRYDTNTGKEGVYVFSRTDAFFFCLAGTHRCNSTYFSSCSGTTTACNSSAQPYRISDMAHNDRSVFETVTEELARYDSALIFIQLHGFAMRDTDPYVIMSNGTRLTPRPDYLDSLKNALHEVDPVLDFRVAHQDLDWTRLIAFNNVQGRFLNGSTDICGQDADTVSGRFIHIEQEKTRLREDSTKWEKMTLAVNRAFPCVSTGIAPLPRTGTLQVAPNPFKHRTLVTVPEEARGPFEVSLMNLEGRVLRTLHLPGERLFTISGEGLPSGVYFILLKDSRQKRYRGKMVVR